MMDNSGSPTGTVQELLRAGIAAAKTGQRTQARDLLTRVVQQDDKNVAGWLWLSSVVDDLANREVCLQHVLSLDPQNEAARRGLEQVRKQTVDELLHSGINAAKLGQRDHARSLLTRVVEQDEKNITGWLWLSSVVNTLDDRELCLENALTLDPGNEAARRGLEQVREQKVAEAPASRASFHVLEAPAEDSSPTAAGLAGWTYTGPTDEFDDVYRCPCCAASTGPDDKKCAACGASLWTKTRKREERSTWLWIGLLAQFLTVFWGAVGIVVVLMVVGYASGVHDLGAMLRSYFGLTSDVPAAVASAILETLPRLYFFAVLASFFFSLAVLVALYLRWRPAWYLFLVSAIWELIMAGVGAARYGVAGLICGGFGVLLAFGMVWLVFQMQDDFFFDRTRILLRPDRDANSGIDYLAHGSRYARRGMWAMAIVHLQRASGMLPSQIETHLALASAYIHVKRYDRASQALDEARRVDADDPHVAELTVLLEKARAVP